MFEGAYHQVSHLVATKEKVETFVTVFDSDKKDHILDHVNHSFDSADSNASGDLIQFGYDLIKELPEHEGSGDIFEEGQPKEPTTY
ncbi:hypothetical protein [Sporosarcina sp. NPDC096371]|uniref:hypothetical protein n=1 Tax=Sporosarcina sp. NPDC096371 TaxID=3364530 RepID=UPI00380C75E7